MAPDSGVECPHCDSRETLRPEWVPRYYRWRAVCDCCSKVTWLDRDYCIVPSPTVEKDVSGNLITGP